MITTIISNIIDGPAHEVSFDHNGAWVTVGRHATGGYWLTVVRDRTYVADVKRIGASVLLDTVARALKADALHSSRVTR